MRSRWIVLVFVVAALAGACTDEPEGSNHEESVPAGNSYEPDIDPAEFVAEIDNPYMPLEPGTLRVYKGKSDGESETVRVLTTYDTKTVMGVECTVVLDEAYVDGELHERTYDWFAQDSEGNVWYFGEDTAEYENGKITSHAGAWEAGIDGAQPGIVMPAAPEVGESYRQEYYAGEAEDMGKVIRFGDSVSTPFAEFQDVLVTEDWTPLEPKVLERKYYAPDYGVVLEEIVRGGRGRLSLVKVETGVRK